jgi:hypothetical protein
MFANRPQAWLRLSAAGLSWKVDHRTAVATIYSASIALWLFGVVDAIAQIMHVLVAGGPAPPWVRLTAVGAAVAVTGLGATFTKSRKGRREHELRRLGKVAVLTINEKDPATLINDAEVRATLAELASYDRPLIEARLRYLAAIPTGEISSLIGPNSGIWTAAQTVAYITDFAPEWLYDCATSRRRDS